jgi:hypothetical protein
MSMQEIVENTSRREKNAAALPLTGYQLHNGDKVWRVAGVSDQASAPKVEVSCDM